jgi:hypothetical protein
MMDQGARSQFIIFDNFTFFKPRSNIEQMPALVSVSAIQVKRFQLPTSFRLDKF